MSCPRFRWCRNRRGRLRGGYSRNGHRGSGGHREDQPQRHRDTEATNQYAISEVAEGTKMHQNGNSEPEVTESIAKPAERSESAPSRTLNDAELKGINTITDRIIERRTDESSIRYSGSYVTAPEEKTCRASD